MNINDIKSVIKVLAIMLFTIGGLACVVGIITGDTGISIGMYEYIDVSGYLDTMRNNLGYIKGDTLLTAGLLTVVYAILKIGTIKRVEA